MDELTIGEVARKSGLRTSAIRYYESEGLIAPVRRVSGQRRYAPAIIGTLALIRTAQAGGFKIAEIRELLHEHNDLPAPQRWQKLIPNKRREADRMLQQALQMQAVLNHLSHCECDTLAACAEHIPPPP